jgi:hypothetical protein
MQVIDHRHPVSPASHPKPARPGARPRRFPPFHPRRSRSNPWRFSISERRDPLLNSWFALAQIRASTGITYMEATNPRKSEWPLIPRRGRRNGRPKCMMSTPATASDLLFVGARECYFHVLNAKSGALLWKTNLGGLVDAAPMTYQVDKNQYVIVIADVPRDVQLSSPRVMRSLHSACVNNRTGGLLSFFLIALTRAHFRAVESAADTPRVYSRCHSPA